MAPGPPSWTSPPPPRAASLPPPPPTFLLLKGMYAVEVTTQSDPGDQTVACTRVIRSPCDGMAAEKRRWSRIVLKAKPYLNKAKAYGGGNSDEGGNRPSLPVPRSPPPTSAGLPPSSL